MLRNTLVCVDVNSGSEGPPWWSDVRMNGFDYLHVFWEVSDDVFEVGWVWEAPTVLPSS